MARREVLRLEGRSTEHLDNLIKQGKARIARTIAAAGVAGGMVGGGLGWGLTA